jgi:hypothetical protein
MAFRNLAAATLLLFSTPAMADAVRVDEPPAPPMAFYVAKGAPDACGSGCDTWIAVEGHIDVGATFRLKNSCVSKKTAICRCIFLRPVAIWMRPSPWATCCAKGLPLPG